MVYRPKTTLEQWRILQAVVDYGGYAQAGEALNKSQSSLNHAVAKLQDMLGVQLLEVIGRKAVLTEAGEVMLRRSRDLSQNVQALEQLAVNINQDWEPEITLAVDLAYPREALIPALTGFLPDSRGYGEKGRFGHLNGSA
jgi:DNA-binding transcriptional LysR family regulator